MIYYAQPGNDLAKVLEPAGSKEIVVGIPSFKNRNAIGLVIQMAARGLKNFFPGVPAAIMISDGGSTDDTLKVAGQAEVFGGIDKIISTYPGPPGKGSAVKDILEAARILNAKACVILEADLRSITPAWIRLLVEPVLHGHVDYLSPFYLRHKYDGILTNSIVYPLTTALYGQDIRQPMGGESGLSRKAVEAFLGEDVWDSGEAASAIDIWMTTTAIIRGLKIGQASLGVKAHDARDPAILKPESFNQAVRVVFQSAGAYSHMWSQVNSIAMPPVFGREKETEPNPIKARYETLIGSFVDGAGKFSAQWKRYLSQENFELLIYAYDGLKGNTFDIADGKWARMLYDYLLAYHRHPGEEDEVLGSLVPLYFLKTADFINKTRELNSRSAEELTLAMAGVFFREKDYLLSRWKAERGGESLQMAG